LYFSYALTVLWHDRQRYLPGVLAVAFSALLISGQWGILLGMFTFASVTIDKAPAQIWLGGPHIETSDLAGLISEGQLARLARQPEVAQVEVYVQQHSLWLRSDGSWELCMLHGMRLEENALGAVREMTPDLRVRLQEKGAIVVDESDCKRLGVKEIGDDAEIHGHRVKVVGVISGFRTPAGAHVFCSIETAQAVLHLPPDQVTYILGRCHDPTGAQTVVQRLRVAYPHLSAFTAAELSLRSRMYWLVETKGGLAIGFAAVLGLLVGTVVTGQTLYSATVAQLRPYAVLWALGIPLRRMAALVMAQAFWVGVAGVALALPAIVLAAAVAHWLKILILLPLWLLVATGTLTLVLALVCGLAGLRLLWQIQPSLLLR